MRTDVDRPRNEEVRAYILAMANELAEMADNIHDSDLADRLRMATEIDGVCCS